MDAMKCSECDHIERDPIGLDTETCLECGGMLEAYEPEAGDEEHEVIDYMDRCDYHAD